MKEKIVDATEYNERVERQDREQQLAAVFNSDIHNDLRRKRDLQSSMDKITNPPISIANLDIKEDFKKLIDNNKKSPQH